MLSPAEIVRANSYLRAEDRDRSVVSRGALRVILSRYLNKNPSQIQFRLDKYKKPYLMDEGVALPCFNISHSADWALIAVSGSEVGVDAEFINTDFPYANILTDYFTEDEVEFIRHKDTDERFYLLWTRKEAFAKATGTGLDNTIKYIPSLNGEHFADKGLSAMADMYTTSFKLNSHYICSVTSGSCAEELKFWEMNF